MTQTLPTDIGLQNSPRCERLLIAVVCLIAGVRVFIFCAAFPFFTNVDETAHFDMVYKYSQGHLPAAPLEKYDSNAVRIIITNATGEYYDQPTDRSPEWLAESFAFLSKEDNRQTWAWPSYYLLAGAWCRLGRLLGFNGGRLLYWIRFLNIPLIAALVWLSYRLASKVFTESHRCRIALAIMVAFFPQDIFFGITPDVLSPVAFAAAFLMLLEIFLAEKLWRYYLFTGLVVAAAFLNKASNIAILLLSTVVIIIKTKQATSQNRFKRYLPSLTAFILAAGAPIVFWLVRNYVLFGDVIGSSASAQLRGWTRKPFAEMFSHPILTPRGLFFFLAELTKTFWRGEIIWREQRMSHFLADLFYCISTAIFLPAALAAIILDKSEAAKQRRFIFTASALVVAMSVLFLAFASTRYEFGDFVYPSREHPYFSSGRLIAGVILPFLLLYITGLNFILTKLRLASRLLVVVIVVVAAITISEIALTLPVFSSPCNWYHLK
jgi:hypothetical protein